MTVILALTFIFCLSGTSTLQNIGFMINYPGTLMNFDSLIIQLNLYDMAYKLII